VNSQSNHGSMRAMFSQPRAFWAVAFGCVVSFMGIGLVDPILASLRDKLHASPSQVELLFTSYLVVTAFAMLVTGWAALPRSRLESWSSTTTRTCRS
jgi:ACDE family multidrug resistance protein